MFGYFYKIMHKRVKQWIIYYFKTYVSLGTFRYNCARGQLNNEGGGKLYEIKRSRDKTGIGK